jgi:hypothetical protein
MDKDTLRENPSINLMVCRDIIGPSDPDELPSTFRAEMWTGGRRTGAAGILQIKLLSTLRTTVSVHSFTIYFSWAFKLA